MAHPNLTDFEPDGVPYSLKAFHGELIVIEPNHGRLLRINLIEGRETRIEQLSDLSAPLGHIVPTSVASLDARFFCRQSWIVPRRGGIVEAVSGNAQRFRDRLLRWIYNHY